jgi:hypothetical protein
MILLYVAWAGFWQPCLTRGYGLKPYTMDTLIAAIRPALTETEQHRPALLCGTL